MRNLVPALILSLLMHIFFFMFGFFRLNPDRDSPAVPQVLTVTLHAPKPEPIAQPEAAPMKKNPAPVVKPEAMFSEKKRDVPAEQKMLQAEKSEIAAMPISANDPKPDPDAGRVETEGSAAPSVSGAENASAHQVFPAVAPVYPTAAHGTADAPPLADVKALPDYSVNPPPEYPPLARHRGYEGQVLLDVWVDRHGKAADLKIARSSGYAVLDQAALQAVRQWLFKPARKGNETIENRVIVPIRFQLH